MLPVATDEPKQLDCQQLHRDGYVLLRQAVPKAWLPALRGAFDAGVKASHLWPVPRGVEWRHSQLDLDPTVQAVCRLPEVLAAVGELIGERFFLSQVEGREPLAGVGHQQLHRDMAAERPGDSVTALVFLDDFGAHNGATRLVPGSHRPAPGQQVDLADESHSVTLNGQAGDILVFDVDLLHGGSCNVTGARRRSMLAGYFAENLYQAHQQNIALRGVRMDTSQRFEP
ncbi:phytanoyl-CoA dioxygenase family protein [Gallaecimonas sp. GXIMD1310]|uniref:phytanoyl-CoA dioxygenase family protein n=1 Tax=Gallaecimonas sp. GXIMD1310 TaxID=3131926 RepID=UPI0032563C31